MTSDHHAHPSWPKWYLPAFEFPQRLYATAISSSIKLDFDQPSFLKLSSRLVEEANDLAGDVLATGLLVVHDTSRGGQDDVAELTRGQQTNGPLLEVCKLDVVAGRDNAGLVEAADQLNDDLAGAVVIDLLELANVAWSTRMC